jgi:selenide,water dikinase
MENTLMTDIKLTHYSIAGGCGCKVPNNLLSDIIKNVRVSENPDIIADFRHNEDSAIVKINEKQALVYSVDFFTPIVDDPEMFGRIAAANAVSDVFAKGAQPSMALSILGFPREIDHSGIPAGIMKGASDLCFELGINILGGHTIYNPQIFFGLSVTGIANIANLKLNNHAKPGDLIYMTKPLGTGIMSTAMKKNSLFVDDEHEMLKHLTFPNKLGAVLGEYPCVNCMTDITGFGLIGHLAEICTASKVSAKIFMDKVKTLPNLAEYIEMGLITNGGQTNWENNRCYVNGIDERSATILSDPQSNGGLLITVNPRHRSQFEQILVKHELGEFSEPIGEITNQKDLLLDVIVG